MELKFVETMKQGLIISITFALVAANFPHNKAT